jgi:uncharacterized protein (TIGR00369 family)
MRRQISYGDKTNGCFGCSPTNPSGLRLQFVETDDGVEVEYVAPRHQQGAPGVVHGGIQATLLDEALCMTAHAKTGTSVVTGELTIRYVRPVPTATRIIARGRIVERKGNSAFIEGGIYLAETGEELTRARGRFFAQAVLEPEILARQDTALQK